MKIEISVDRKWVRVTLGTCQQILSMEEWSLAISRPGEFLKGAR